MTTLPEAGIGSDTEELAVAPRSLWLRVRALAGERLSYALADQVAYSFGNMIVAALLSRHTAQREFGVYILTQRAMDVLIQLSNVFLWAPFTFNLPGTAERRQRLYLGSIVLQQVAVCGLAAVLLWALGLWSATPERGLYHGVFAPLTLTSVGILFREFTRRMYFSFMRFKAAFWTDVATVALQIAGVGALYKFGRLDVPGTLWMLSGGAILVSLWWVLTEWRTYSVRARETFEDLALNFRLGRWLLGSNMIFMVSSQCNPWVISAFLGGSSVGAYTKCESVVNIPRVALTSLQNTMAPTMARVFNDGGKPALRKIVTRFDRMLMLGSIVFAAGIILFGPWVAELIFKGAPANSRTILVLLSLNFVAFAATLAQSYGLTAIGKAGLTFYANLIGLALQVVVTMWLVKHYHLPGAAMALLVGSLVVVVVREIFYMREMRREA